MAKVRDERLTVMMEQGFVVFLIGMRVNRWWQFPIAMAVSAAMNRMLRQLTNQDDSPLLAFEQTIGLRTALLVQYWRSHEELQAYAHAKEKEHVPAWRTWIQKWSGGAVGIFHETYLVEPGTYECVYHHMPPYGLGKAGTLQPAEGALRTATKRLGATEPRRKRAA